jgi:trk system potassium uptake protein TrkA
MIACTSRDEINLVAGTLVKKLSNAHTIVRTSNPEYIEAWQERQIEVDFMVSSELETAHAVSRTIGVPAAKQTDVFAEGQVQIVEFESRWRRRGKAATAGDRLQLKAAVPKDQGSEHHPG